MCLFPLFSGGFESKLETEAGRILWLILDQPVITAHCTVPIAHCRMHTALLVITAHCTLHFVHYIEQCKLRCTALSSLHTGNTPWHCPHCTLRMPHCTLQMAHCALHTARWGSACHHCNWKHCTVHCWSSVFVITAQGTVHTAAAHCSCTLHRCSLCILQIANCIMQLHTAAALSALIRCKNDNCARMRFWKAPYTSLI